MFNAQRMKHYRVARLAAVILAILLTAIWSPAAHAQQDSAEIPDPPDDVTVLGQQGSRIFFEAPLGFFYNAPDSDHFAIAGDTLEDFCDVKTPQDTFGVAQQNDDGTWTNRVPSPLYRKVYIYDDPAENMADSIGMLCGPIAGGEPAPEPVAIGWVRQSARTVTESPYWTFTAPQGPGHYTNSIRGWAWGDGVRYRVNGVADYEITPDYNPQDGPPDFKKISLVVEPVGPSGS